MALLTIVLGILIVTPTAFWVRLKLPRLRPVIEFITLLPLVIPPIVIVFGYIRLYNTSQLSAAHRQRLWHQPAVDVWLCKWLSPTCIAQSTPGCGPLMFGP